jgi:hypothetical protein
LKTEKKKFGSLRKANIFTTMNAYMLYLKRKHTPPPAVNVIRAKFVFSWKYSDKLKMKKK